MSSARGRGRGRGRGGVMVNGRLVGNDLINIGVIVRYANGDTNQGHMRWPSSITEEQALRLLVDKLPEADLADIVQVSFSQSPRVGIERIHWIDNAPHGQYYFNQHLYGENGVQTLLNAELREKSLFYNADMEDIHYEGSIVDYLQRPQDTRSKTPVGPRNYDPDTF